MEKSKLLILINVIIISLITACEKESKPLEAVITYSVIYEGNSENIIMDTKGSPPADGYCYITESSGTYPLAFTFNFSIGNRSQPQTFHSISANAIRMREGMTPEIVPCDTFSIDYKGVKQQAGTLQCGDTQEGKCAFSGINYNKKENIIQGSFECGEFRTNTGTTMKITRGNFTLIHCKKN